MSTEIYVVFATDTDRDRLVGHAMGDEEDIKAYFDDRKGYGLRLQLVNVISVPSGFASKAKQLREQRKELERQISAINKQLNASQ